MNSGRPLQRSAVTTPRPYQGRVGLRLIARVNGPEAFSPHLGENLPPLLLGIVAAIAQLVSLPQVPFRIACNRGPFRTRIAPPKEVAPLHRADPLSLFRHHRCDGGSTPNFSPRSEACLLRQLSDFLVSKLIDPMKATTATHRANRAVAIRRLPTVETH